MTKERHKLRQKRQRSTRRHKSAPPKKVAEDVYEDELFSIQDLPEPSGTFQKNSKLADPAVYNGIIELLREGNYESVAAQAVGVEPVTLNNWLKMGRQGKNRLYYQFYCDVKRAVAEGEGLLVSKIRKAADKDWRAALALISRRHRSKWAETPPAGAGSQTFNDNRQQLALQVGNDPESRDLMRRLVDSMSGSRNEPEVIEHQDDDDE